MHSRSTDPVSRGVRSFVRREGRLTPAQSEALEKYWPLYGIDSCGSLDLDMLFGRRTSRVLEVGFGSGEHLLARALAEPECDFLGIEVHRPGVGRLLREANAAGVQNLRIVVDDAVEVLRDQMPPAAIDELVLYFPDPWPKKRHHKRRLVQSGFVQLVARILKAGGLWRLATDWPDYAFSIRSLLDGSPEFDNEAGTLGYVERPSSRPMTRFERRGERLGHSVFDLAYRRRGSPDSAFTANRHVELPSMNL